MDYLNSTLSLHAQVVCHTIINTQWLETVASNNGIIIVFQLFTIASSRCWVSIVEYPSLKRLCTNEHVLACN